MEGIINNPINQSVSSPQANTERPPEGASTSSGNFSPLSPALSEGASAIAPVEARGSARSMFRKDYHNKVRISKREAADYAGVSVRTIESWIYRKKNPLPRCAARGAYVIDRIELEKYLRKGVK